MKLTEKRKVGRPPKYKTEEERKAAQEATRKKSRAKYNAKRHEKVRNITISSDNAERFLELRDKYNKESGLPFDLTNSQFFALMLAKWEQS